MYKYAMMMVLELPGLEMHKNFPKMLQDEELVLLLIRL